MPIHDCCSANTQPQALQLTWCCARQRLSFSPVLYCTVATLPRHLTLEDAASAFFSPSDRCSEWHLIIKSVERQLGNKHNTTGINGSKSHLSSRTDHQRNTKVRRFPCCKSEANIHFYSILVFLILMMY